MLTELAMESELLSAVRPYLQFFSVLTLMPPPSFYEIYTCGYRRRLLILVFACYTCCAFFLGIYIAYNNIITMNMEVTVLHIEDFTYLLGLVIICLYILLLASIHVNLPIYFRRLNRIYMEIAAIEMDIDCAAQGFGRQRARCGFRRRLALHFGLWLPILFTVYPRAVFSLLTDYMRLHDRLLGVIVMIVLQLKCVEYSLFVLLVQELLLRLRHTLFQLQQELTACESLHLFDVLCTALRRNQLMMSRIWKLVGELEGYFMLPMLFIFLYNGITLLQVVNWTYIQALNPNDCCRYWRLFSLMVIQMNLVLPCWISQKCINTYNSFNRILHDIRCGFGSVMPDRLKIVLREYVLQLEHLKLRFTCGGFFDINLKCFGGMIITLISYATILIQFKLQDLVEARQAAKQRFNLNINSNSSVKA